MTQMSIKPELRIEPDLSRFADNKIFNLLKPTVFEDDGMFCCLLGPDLRFGIKGFGHTPEESIEDWVTSVGKRIERPHDNDEVVHYIMRILRANGRHATASTGVKN
jgi:hypothetical protein